jgi:hypothetical protein
VLGHPPRVCHRALTQKAYPISISRTSHSSDDKVLQWRIGGREFKSCSSHISHRSFSIYFLDSGYLVRMDYNYNISQSCSSSVGVRTRGGPKPTSKCCVSLSWMVMQGEYTGVYPGSGKRRPYVQRGEEVCISLHRSARVGVTSRRERAPSPSLKERKKGQGWLLEVSISCFFFVVCCCVVGCFVPLSFVEPWPALL